MMARFQAAQPTGVAVAQLEILVRTAVFQSANELVGWMLQQAVDRIDAAYQPKPGEERKGRDIITAQGIFGHFPLNRDYYYHPGKQQGHYPADAALGLEVCYTPALAKLLCLEGADEATYLKAERHLEQTGGIRVSARQIQRVVQRVGTAAQQWQERSAQPSECERCDAPLIYLSADGTGVPMVPEELLGRKGKQADGKAKSRQVYLGCVFTQHKVDEKGRPVRDWESTTYVSSFKSIDDFGPLLRQEGLRRGMATAKQIVLLIDGASGLEKMGKQNFKGCVQIVDFFHAMEHAGLVLEALLGKDHPDYKRRLRRLAKRLLKDKVEALIKETRKQCAGSPCAEAVEKALTISPPMSAGCSMAPSGRQGTSSVRAWWKRAAKPSLAGAANNQGCSGPSRELKTFWHCAASTAAGAWTNSGSTGSTPRLPPTIVCPWQLNQAWLVSRLLGTTTRKTEAGCSL